MPSLRNSVFDEFFGTPFLTRTESSMMKTDIREQENAYELFIDLPGVKKEDVHAELNDGCLTVSAQSSSSSDEKDENGRYICRERYSGSFSRSFYVGEAVTEQDITAKFEDGTLKLTVPKKQEAPRQPNRYIAID
ncbi:MAG: Hsp20/alpha crystallin family protein [Oscillospiraceae bacterium]